MTSKVLEEAVEKMLEGEIASPTDNDEKLLYKDLRGNVKNLLGAPLVVPTNFVIAPSNSKQRRADLGNFDPCRFSNKELQLHARIHCN